MNYSMPVLRQFALVYRSRSVIYLYVIYLSISCLLLHDEIRNVANANIARVVCESC